MIYHQHQSFLDYIIGETHAHEELQKAFGGHDSRKFLLQHDTYLLIDWFEHRKQMIGPLGSFVGKSFFESLGTSNGIDHRIWVDSQAE